MYSRLCSIVLHTYSLVARTRTSSFTVQGETKVTISRCAMLSVLASVSYPELPSVILIVIRPRRGNFEIRIQPLYVWALLSVRQSDKIMFLTICNIQVAKKITLCSFSNDAWKFITDLTIATNEDWRHKMWVTVFTRILSSSLSVSSIARPSCGVTHHTSRRASSNEKLSGFWRSRSARSRCLLSRSRRTRDADLLKARKILDGVPLHGLGRVVVPVAVMETVLLE